MAEQAELFEVGQRMPIPGASPRQRSRATPAPVGSGPEGETCKTCLHYTRAQYHDYVHLKCGLMRAVWTHGPGTDIKAKWPACREWVPGSQQHPSLIPPGFAAKDLTTPEGRAIAADWWLEAGDERKAELLRDR